MNQIDSQHLNPSCDAAALAPLRREFVCEALDGMMFQAEGAIRFLERGDDRQAEAALRRVFDFARHAAGEMKAIVAASAPKAEESRP